MSINQLLLLLCVFFILSCKKKTEPEPVEPLPDLSYADTITIDSRFQFSGVINNQFVSVVSGVNSNFFSGGGNFQQSSVEDLSKCLLGFQISSPLGDRIVFNKGVLYYDGEFPTYAAGFDFFIPGEYPMSLNWEDGISLRYKDDNGVVWGTDLGSANQNGSSVKILSRKFELDHMDYTAFRILAEFNCNLYNQNGESRKLIKGMLVGRIYIWKPIV